LAIPAQLFPETVNRIPSWFITIWTRTSRCGNMSIQEEDVDGARGAGIEDDE